MQALAFRGVSSLPFYNLEILLLVTGRGPLNCTGMAMLEYNELTRSLTLIQFQHMEIIIYQNMTLLES